MAIIATGGEGKSFAPPPEGTHQAVCVDVIDAGMHDNPFNPGTQQHKVDLVWQLNELREDGQRFQAWKRYTLSLNEKAVLRHDLESWRGRPFTADELRGFDVETVKGVNCLLNIVHRQSQKNPGRVYGNIASVMPLMKGMLKIAPLNYERRTTEPEAQTAQDEPVELESIPF